MDGASMLSTFCDPECAEEGGGGDERSLGKQKSSDVYSLNWFDLTTLQEDRDESVRIQKTT